MALATLSNCMPADRSASCSANDKPSSNPAPYATTLAGITILAIILRLHAISAKSFWLDEGLSFDIARLPWAQFLHAIWSHEMNMSLYYLLLRFWLALGRSEASVRGLSVLFSVATVPCMFSLGTRLFGRRAGLLAAFLLAINVFHIRYAQEARSYAAVAFFAVVATWLFVRNLQEPSRSRWGLYAVACALGTYSHFFVALLVLAHGLLLLFWRNEISWRKLGYSLLTYGALISPIVLVVLRDNPARLWWVPLMGLDLLLHLGIVFSGNYGQLLLALVIFAIGIAAMAASRAGRANGWEYGLVFSWLVVPVAIVAAISLLRPMFVQRYLIFCLPALLLLVAVGISQLRPRILSWGLLAAIAVCSLLADVNYYRADFDTFREDWRAASTYVLEHAQPGDSIFFYNSAGEGPFDYYAWSEQLTTVRPKALQASWLGIGSQEDDLVAVPGTGLQAARPIGRRVWLVLMSADGSKQEEDTGKAVGKWLSSGRRQVDTRVFARLFVALFDGNTAITLPGGDHSSSVKR